jgi:hypothetical protein
MGQGTLAFTKQMFRVFNFVELEESDHLVVKAWSSILGSSEMGRLLIAMRSEDEQTQANKHICIRTLHHAKENIIKNMQYEIECATTVTWGKETSNSKLRSRRYHIYVKQV